MMEKLCKSVFVLLPDSSALAATGKRHAATGSLLRPLMNFTVWQKAALGVSPRRRADQRRSHGGERGNMNLHDWLDEYMKTLCMLADRVYFAVDSCSLSLFLQTSQHFCEGLQQPSTSK